MLDYKDIKSQQVLNKSYEQPPVQNELKNDFHSDDDEPEL